MTIPQSHRPGFFLSGFWPRTWITIPRSHRLGFSSFFFNYVFNPLSYLMSLPHLKNPVCETVVWSLTFRVQKVFEKKWKKTRLWDRGMVTGGPGQKPDRKKMTRSVVIWSLAGCKIVFVEPNFKAKILHKCGLYLLLCIQQPSSSHLIHYFTNNLHNLNFHMFSKSDENKLSLIGKHSSSYHNEFTIFGTRFSHFAFNAVSLKKIGVQQALNNFHTWTQHWEILFNSEKLIDITFSLCPDLLQLITEACLQGHPLTTPLSQTLFFT